MFLKGFINFVSREAKFYTRKIKGIYFLLVFIISFTPLYAENKIDKLIRELDRQVELGPGYVKKKLVQIEHYKSLINDQAVKTNPLEQYHNIEKVFEEYKNFNSDSAFHYSLKMLEIAYSVKNENLINASKINISLILLSTGMFRESIDTLSSVPYESLNPEKKMNYNYLYALNYFELADNAYNDGYKTIYNNKGNTFLTKAISLANPDSPYFYLYSGLQNIRNIEVDEGIAHYEKLLNHFKLPQRDIAIAASSLAWLYESKNNPEKVIELLIMAAIADIKSCTKETVAMTNLSEQLFKIGRVQSAYKYVKVALDEAYFYKANHRKLKIIKILPIIEGKQLSMVEKQRKTYLYYSIIVTLLSLLVITFLVIIRRQYKSLKATKASLAESNKNLLEANEELHAVNEKLQEVNHKLQEVNKIKEEYIGTFFNTISENMEALEKFKQAITRKIKSNKIEDIASIIENIDIEKERERLYKSFDDIFLKIFPGFLDKFNTLFNKEDHIVLNEGEGLTPELRIFALIRLGIHETEAIAKILRYAVRTIYTYKTRIKNKSLVPNDEFEERLLDIKAF